VKSIIIFKCLFHEIRALRHSFNIDIFPVYYERQNFAIGRAAIQETGAGSLQLLDNLFNIFKPLSVELRVVCRDSLRIIVFDFKSVKVVD
jgi:hypothetical protein